MPKPALIQNIGITVCIYLGITVIGIILSSLSTRSALHKYECAHRQALCLIS